ncbi:MAG: hypothetical protein Kow0025_21210 [Thermodesulfovibrionales bacterium]
MAPFRRSRPALLALALAGGFLLPAACDQTPPNPVEQYGTGLVNSYTRSKTAASAANLDSLRRSAAAYRASNGRYPETFEELLAFSGIEVNPADFDYDPATGRIDLR